MKFDSIVDKQFQLDADLYATLGLNSVKYGRDPVAIVAKPILYKGCPSYSPSELAASIFIILFELLN